MTVYVDDSRHPILRGGRTLMLGHMIADSRAEADHMARALRVPSSACHGDHWDLCLDRRRAAVGRGAVPVTERQMAAMRARRRATGKLGRPEDAVAWLKHWLATRPADDGTRGAALCRPGRAPRRRRGPPCWRPMPRATSWRRSRRRTASTRGRSPAGRGRPAWRRG
ncbi:DUF4031 domain-containing protein [Phenylobacterium sp.]|uniref:DUF4031 domain-containing protein n=1 Tax=Phenylobacterium sp. TaxID=1871053 RepID=UPI0025D126D7|nr:DUF4031 domain-containing protein [Phenylobacterium sp.]